MNKRGLISSRSDVVALLSGELLELRTEKRYLFQTTYHWEQHYYLLTSIGILRFSGGDLNRAPSFIPIKAMVQTELVDDEQSKYTTQKTLLIKHLDPNDPSANHINIHLSSETVSQVIEWTETIKRLRQLDSESCSAVGAIGTRLQGKSIFDNSSRVGHDTVAALTVKKVCQPSRKAPPIRNL